MSTLLQKYWFIIWKTTQCKVGKRTNHLEIWILIHREYKLSKKYSSKHFASITNCRTYTLFIIETMNKFQVKATRSILN